MTLEELTDLEEEWLNKHPTGSLEDMHILCRQTGVYEAWKRIFELYVIEARKGEKEALKRALFLYWYSCSEPNELSGLYMLDEALVLEMLGMVNDTVRKGELDTELKWMLAYYYFITDWYIDQHKGFDELKKASKVNTELWRGICLKSSFSDRGQMGYYWKSIQANLV
jgi:hypothetical protein